MYAKFKLNYKVCCLEVWKIPELAQQIASLCLYFLLMKTFTQVILWVGDQNITLHVYAFYSTFLHDYTCWSGTILTWFFLLTKHNLTSINLFDSTLDKTSADN